MEYVYIVRNDNTPSGIQAVYATKDAARAEVRRLGGQPDYPDKESGAWIVVASVK